MEKYDLLNIKRMFSERIKDLRTQNNLSQYDIARIIGVKQASYEQYESKKSLPAYDNLIKLALYFEVSTDYLLGLSEG